jgi:hypothetical protein
VIDVHPDGCDCLVCCWCERCQVAWRHLVNTHTGQGGLVGDRYEVFLHREQPVTPPLGKTG